MYHLEISEEAEMDADSAASYYDELSPGLGLRFLDEVLSVTMQIAKNPTVFHYYRRVPPIRRCNLSVFPYAIYYHTDKKLVRILAVINEKRSEKYVRHRLK